MFGSFRLCFLFLLCSSCGEPAAPSPDYTWSNGASDFFGDHCVRCHDAGHGGGDYSVYEEVLADAEPMRCGLAPEELDECEPPLPDPRTFPTGPRPPEEEVAEVIQWLEDGLPR